MTKTILSVRDLKQHFKIDRKTVTKAVDGVSFDIYEGETFSVVGESGSGKSTLGRSIIRIYEPQGEVTFLDQKISGKISRKQASFVHQNMQMIFQDPMSSLNPRKKIADTVAYGLEVQKIGTPQSRKEEVINVLKRVGLSEEFLSRYPHQFSGGQRQRIGIARAIVMKPKLIIADEIISALDVSIQAQVINLMKELQKDSKLTYMFIAHDLSMVRSISDRVAVMHLGHIVELGNIDDIYTNPVHPYTKALLSAIPHPDPIGEKTRKRVRYVKGDIDYTLGEDHQLSETHRVKATEAELKEWLHGNYSTSLQPLQ